MLQKYGSELCDLKIAKVNVWSPDYFKAVNKQDNGIYALIWQLGH
jgi:hypothetical protein